MENYENFWGAGLGAGREVVSSEVISGDWVDSGGALQKYPDLGKRAAVPGFPAEGPDHISYNPLGGISCI
jgi:hypothetical protein